MRIWDINPGYLNDKSLLKENLVLHDLCSIAINNEISSSNHPEAKRWIEFIGALNKRHELIIAEMDFRGLKHCSQIEKNDNNIIWPSKFVDEPFRQFEILYDKYNNKSSGRIPLPISAQNLWSQHKYSVMARDVNECKKIGRHVSAMRPDQNFSDLSRDLVDIIRTRPSIGGIRNSLQHMWGYFKNSHSITNINSLDLYSLLSHIQKYSHSNRYILESTALSELRIWI